MKLTNIWANKSAYFEISGNFRWKYTPASWKAKPVCISYPLLRNNFPLNMVNETGKYSLSHGFWRSRIWAQTPPSEGLSQAKTISHLTWGRIHGQAHAHCWQDSCPLYLLLESSLPYHMGFSLGFFHNASGCFPRARAARGNERMSRIINIMGFGNLISEVTTYHFSSILFVGSH